MTEIYKNGKAKKTESEKSKNKESGCTPDKNYAKRHNQTLAQTLRLEVEKMIALLQTPIDSFCLL